MLENLSYQIKNRTYLVLMDRLYSRNGLWVQSHGCRLIIGVTDSLAGDLRQISSVKLPPIGSNVRAGSAAINITKYSEVEEFASPLSGRVREVNLSLEQLPELILQDPFGVGWLFEVDPFDWETDKEGLLSPIEFFDLQTENES